ncbi:MAG TPA: protein kinase [Terriglobales bacterium]|nr:protein kinase [Terriglobales bacterium]
MIDQVLGHYRILQKIGFGGMGDVYRAHDDRLDRDVAIKILRPGTVGDPDRLRRFEQEARAAAALNHPNIVAIYDIGTHDGSPYIISEMLEGETLRDKLVKGALSVRTCTDYGRQVASGLVAAHEKHIIHRDLKPENLFITRDGQVKILDFGIAKLTAHEDDENPDLISLTTQTKVGTVLGTVGYMSPEQLRGKTVDHRSDIFSLGAILYEMLTGTKAFQGETNVDTMLAVLNADPKELTASRENIPVVFEQIIHRCLEKDPENRFQSARDLAFALGTVSGTTSSRQIVVARNRWTKIRRYLPLAAAMLALVVLSLILERAFTPSKEVKYSQLTFERGTVYSARFRPDGNSVIYAAEWNGQPMEIYSTVGGDSPQSQPLGLKSEYLLAISRDNELAVALRWQHGAKLDETNGVLASTPLAGGTPREILEDVRWADWSPDKRLAVVHHTPGQMRLEFPIGKVLYQSAGGITHIRFSPQGDRIAFLEHPDPWDDRGTVCVVDMNGKMTSLSPMWSAAEGVAWSPKGDEIWFTATDKGTSNRKLMAVTLSGKRRTVLDIPGGLNLQDIASDGRVLITMDRERLAMEWSSGQNKVTQDLTWYDWSLVRDVSRDGQWVLFEEGSEPSGKEYTVGIRKTDGSPPIRLGDGTAGGLSPDGKWAASVFVGSPQHVSLFPVGPGQTRELTFPQFDFLANGTARYMPDGKHLLLEAREPGHSLRTYLIDLSGIQPPRPVTPERTAAILPSPDGKYLAGTGVPHANDPRKLTLFPLDGAPLIELAPTDPPWGVMQWSEDSKSIFVYRQGEAPVSIYRFDIASRKLTPVRDVMPANRAGVISVSPLMCDMHVAGCAYSYFETLSGMYVVTGLH